MAHPIYVAEQAMKIFIAQWLSGLKPSLKLSTKIDGTIVVMYEVSSVAVNSKKDNCITNGSRRRRRSGINSRIRRKLSRCARSDVTDDQPTKEVANLSTEFISTSALLTPVKEELSFQKLESIDIVPVEPPKNPSLSIQAQSSVSIPPRRIYHPAILKACENMHGKHPSQLTPDEVRKFKLYQEYKARNGEPPIEEDIIFQPCGGLRTCVQCGQLT